MPGEVRIPLEASFFLRYARFVVPCFDLVILILHLTII
jgi:hypothetical protein